MKRTRIVFGLISHIEYLLLRHDCVVVPEVGAFINVRHAARYDAETNIWYPMKREVRFNSAVRHDDGLLASSFARRERISFEEGREMVRKEVAQMREALESDGEITLDHLGILEQHEGTLSFSPLQRPGVLTEAYGYYPAPIRKEGLDEIRERRELQLQTNAGRDIDSQDNSGKRGRTFDTRRYYYIPVNKMLARAIACTLIVIAAAITILLPSDTSNRNARIDEASVLPVKRLVEKTAETSVSDTLQSEPAEAERHEMETARYHIIVATFRSPAEAEEFIAQNTGTGYALRTVSSKTMSRVAAKSSDSREDMQREMMSADFRMRFGEAWIWEQPE